MDSFTQTSLFYTSAGPDQPMGPLGPGPGARAWGGPRTYKTPPPEKNTKKEKKAERGGGKMREKKKEKKREEKKR